MFRDFRVQHAGIVETMPFAAASELTEVCDDGGLVSDIANEQYLVPACRKDLWILDNRHLRQRFFLGEFCGDC